MRLPHSERSRAVLIGTSTYAADSGFAPVPQVAENLARFAALLRELTNLTHIEVLADPGSPEDFARALEPAVDAAEDLLLFYYAGHGVTIGNNSTELALTHRGSTLRRSGYSTLPYTVIRDDIRASRAAVKVVILDCCHSGKAFGHAALAGDDDNEALRELAEIEGAYVLTAATKFAAAQGPDGCTAFTGMMLRLLRAGDPDAGEYLSFARLFPLLDAALRRSGYPRPRATGRNTAAELALARNVAWAPAAAEPEQPPAPPRAKSAPPRAKSAPRVAEPAFIDLARREDASPIVLRPRYLRTLEAPAPVLSLAFSPNGAHLGLACRGTNAFIVDLMGLPLHQLGHGRRIAYSADLAFNRHSLSGSQFTDWDIDFAPDGRLVATAIGFGPGRLWNPATGKEIIALGNTGPVRGVRFSPDSRLLVTLDSGGMLIYDTATRIPLWEGGERVSRCAFSPDGAYLATTWVREEHIRIWRMDARQPGMHVPHRVIPAQRSFWIEWDPRGDRLATISMGGKTSLWDVHTGELVRTFYHRDQLVDLNAMTKSGAARAHVETLTFSPDGRLLATSADDNTIRIWNPDTGSCLHTITHDAITTHAAFSPDGGLIATAARDKTIQLWELNPTGINR